MVTSAYLAWEWVGRNLSQEGMAMERLFTPRELEVSQVLWENGALKPRGFIRGFFDRSAT
ncbi:MAG: hypothetical protein ABIH23_25490 [bacterium]